MNGSGGDNFAPQINTLLWIQKLCQLNNFRTIQSEDETKHYNQTVLEMKEEKKFLGSFGWFSGPTEMDTTRRNLLETDIRDEEISSNTGNLRSILELKSRGIHCYKMSWKQFKETEWSVDSKLIALIISRPSQFPSRIFVHSGILNNNISIELQKKEVEEFPENPFWSPVVMS